MNMTTAQQFDSDYKALRLAVIRGQVSREQAKDWIMRRGMVTALMMDEEKAQLVKRMCSMRVNLDIPILDEE